jgi:signal transduction histidine kinase
VDPVSTRAGDLPATAGRAGLTRFPTHRWVFALTVAFLWAAAVLRSVLAFDGRQRLLALALLVAWLVLVLAVPLAERVWAPSFAFLLAAQSAVILVLLTQSDSSDFFAVLLAAPTMQAMERWRSRAVAALIAVFAALTGLGLASDYQVVGALPLVALYAATNVFFAAYVFAARRAVEARARSESLALDLREANQRLVESGEQAERLGAARERQQLARDLHDSVTQTLFSMTLTAQSALLLLRRDSREVTAQLDQIDELARAALEEMAALGAGAGPATGVAGRRGRAPRRAAPALCRARAAGRPRGHRRGGR